MASSKGYNAGRVYLQVVPSYDGFMKSLREDMPVLTKAFEAELEKSFDKAAGTSGTKFGKEVSKAVGDNIKIDDAWTKTFKKSLAKAESDLGDSSEAMRGHIKELRDELDAGGVDSNNFQLKVQALGNELRKMGQEEGLSPQVRQNYEQAARSMLGARDASARTTAELKKATAASKATADAEKDRANAHRKAGRDSNVAAKAASRLSQILSGSATDSQDGANAFRFFNFAILALAALGPSVIPVIAAIGGAIAALGPIALGVGAGLGVFALGLSGISDAVKALDADQQATKTGSAGYARAVKNAARQVADARRNLADAYRDSADGVENALENQRDAERRLADAMKDSRKAQQDLTAARKEAKQELEDLNTQIAQNNLDERQGVIDLFNAYNEYGAVMSDGGSTNLEREQADIALKQAQLNLVKIREEQKRLTDEKAAGDRKGVEGSDKVTEAQDKVTEAIDREKEARRDLGKAAKDVDKARADGARRVADAQRALTRAQEDYAYAVQGGTENVDKLAQAMDKLSPAGQRFARFIQSLKGGFKDIRDIAQTNMLPGLEEGMRTVMEKYGPGFKTFIGDMSTTLGNLSIKAGEVFSNDNFSRFFKTIGDAATQFTDDAGTGFLGFLEGLAGFFDAATPTALKLSGYIKDIGVNFGTWTNSEEGRTSLGRFFDYVEKVGPKVKDFFVQLGLALGNVAVALAPVGESVLSYLTDFFEFIAGVDPDILRPILLGILAIVVALQVASGIMAAVSIIAAVAGAPILVLVAAIAALVAAFVFLSRSGEENSKTFDSFMTKIAPLIAIFKDLGGLIKDRIVKTFKEDLLPALREIGAFFTDEFIPALAEFYPTIRPIVKFLLNVVGVLLGSAINGIKNIVVGAMKIITGIFKVISGIVKIFQGDFKQGFSDLWEGVKAIFEGAIQAIVGFFEFGFIGAIKNQFVKLFSLDILGIVKNFFPMMRRLLSGGFKKITDFFSGFGKKVVDTFGGMRDGLKNVFGKIKSFVNDVRDAIVNLGEKAETVAGRIGDFFKKRMGNGILTVVDLIVNKALIGGINKIGGWLGLGGKDKELIPPVNLPKPFHAGGYTGPGSKYTPAGIVHADEFVIRKESRQRIEAARPGFLDALNRNGDVSGYATGGRVWPTKNHFWQTYSGHDGIDFNNANGGKGNGMGDPYFASADGIVAYTGSGRGYGRKVELNIGAGTLVYGHSSAIGVKPGQIVKAGQQLGNIGSTGNSTGPHLHFGFVGEGPDRGASIANWLSGAASVPGSAGKTGGGDTQSVAEKVFGKIGGIGKSAILNPKKFLTDRIDSGFSKVKDVSGGLLSMLKSVPSSLLGKVVDKVKGFATGALGSIYGSIKGRLSDDGPERALEEELRKKAGRGGRFAPPESKLYDDGGWLPPGHTSVYNATGRPEPVFNPQQWEKIKDGKGGGDTIYDLKAYGAEPEAVARELAAKIARQQRMARRSGTLARRGR